MAYITQEKLLQMGFAYIGKNVQISDKASVYNCERIYIDDNSRIDDFCVISGEINIGKYVHITPTCLVAGGEVGVILEDYSTLAYGVRVFSQSDDYSGKTMVNSLIPTKFKDEFFAKVLIKKHVIIGSGTTILPGVTIEEGCSVGAMSLVTTSTKSWGVYVGIPAKRIKERKQDLLILEQQFLKESNDDPI